MGFEFREYLSYRQPINMTEFFTKDNFTEGDIHSLIAASTEESINLDFKANGSIENTDGKKNEIAKDVSSFANSDGGIIIYGINEQNHIAESVSPINGNTFTKEWLEQVINSRIQKKIPNLKIFPIRIDNNPLQTIYIVKIPQSYNAPHMASDKRFYKRYNFQSVQMEEYEVRELYNRKTQTDLEIGDIIIKSTGGGIRSGLLREVEFNLTFQVKNVSNTVEEIYKLEISLPRIPFLRSFADVKPMEKHIIRTEGDYLIFSVPNSSPIFQQELTSLISANIRIQKDTLHLFENQGITTKLYFSNGTKEIRHNLSNTLSYQGTLLNEWNWE